MDDRRVLTLRDLAAYLRVHPNTVYRLVKRGQIPAFKVGSDWRFYPESIDRWRLARERPAKEQVSRVGLASEILDILYWHGDRNSRALVDFPPRCLSANRGRCIPARARGAAGAFHPRVALDPIPVKGGKDVTVIEVEPGDESWGEGFTDAVERAVPAVIEEIRHLCGC